MVLITLDTTRADHLSTYGYGRPTDPFLAGLAARSRTFETAVPAATWTLPSHASMFTGLVPAEHGCWKGADPEDPETPAYPALSPSLPLVTTRLAEVGYHLVGAVGGPFTAAKYGFARDFDRYLDPGEEWQLAGTELNAWLARELEARPRDRPLFLFVNYFDAHAPHDPPPRASWPFPEGVGDLPPVYHDEGQFSAEAPPSAEWLGNALAQYDRELLVQDEALEALFALLEGHGLLDDALVIVTSDHGEAFGENGQYGHGNLPFESVARVPLVVHRAPDGPVDRVEPPVSLTGIPATVLAALDLPALPGARGADLLGDSFEAGDAYSEHRDPDSWVGSLRGEEHRYWRPLAPPDPPAPGETGLSEFLSEVRGEGAELALEEALLTERQATAGLALRARFQALFDSWRPPPGDVAAVELSEEERQRLNAIGYN